MRQSSTRQAEQKRRFDVGSRVFFSGLDGFSPHDNDEIEFEDHPRLYRDVLQFRKKDGTRCFFKWRLMSKDEFIVHALESTLPMEAGKFLVPAVAEFLGFTLDDLRRLAPVFDRMDARHEYEQIIFKAYLENGGFYLTEAQRLEAFQSYKESRT